MDLVIEGLGHALAAMDGREAPPGRVMGIIGQGTLLPLLLTAPDETVCTTRIVSRRRFLISIRSLCN